MTHASKPRGLGVIPPAPDPPRQHASERLFDLEALERHKVVDHTQHINMVACALSISTCRPFIGSRINTVQPRPAGVRPQRSALIPRAGAAELFQLAAETAGATKAAVGTVDAPGWVLPAGVVGVTLLSILSGYLLKPGKFHPPLSSLPFRSCRYCPWRKF